MLATLFILCLHPANLQWKDKTDEVTQWCISHPGRGYRIPNVKVAKGGEEDMEKLNIPSDLPYALHSFANVQRYMQWLHIRFVLRDAVRYVCWGGAKSAELEETHTYVVDTALSLRFFASR